MPATYRSRKMCWERISTVTKGITGVFCSHLYTPSLSVTAIIPGVEQSFEFPIWCIDVWISSDVEFHCTEAVHNFKSRDSSLHGLNTGKEKGLVSLQALKSFIQTRQQYILSEPLLYTLTREVLLASESIVEWTWKTGSFVATCHPLPESTPTASLAKNLPCLQKIAFFGAQCLERLNKLRKRTKQWMQHKEMLSVYVKICTQTGRLQHRDLARSTYVTIDDVQHSSSVEREHVRDAFD